MSIKRSTGKQETIDGFPNPVYEKCTPKQKAADLLFDNINHFAYNWVDQNEQDYDGMTEKERTEVENQMENYLERINKILESGLK